MSKKGTEDLYAGYRSLIQKGWTEEKKDGARIR